MKSSIFIFIHLLAISFVNFSFSQEIEWQNTIGGTGTDRLNSIEQTLDRGYMALYSEENQNQDWRIIVIKADSSGNILWSKSFDGAGYHPVPDLLQCKDGNFQTHRATVRATGATAQKRKYKFHGLHSLVDRA